MVASDDPPSEHPSDHCPLRVDPFVTLLPLLPLLLLLLLPKSLQGPLLRDAKCEVIVVDGEAEEEEEAKAPLGLAGARSRDIMPSSTLRSTDSDIRWRILCSSKSLLLPPLGVDSSRSRGGS